MGGRGGGSNIQASNLVANQAVELPQGLASADCGEAPL